MNPKLTRTISGLYAITPDALNLAALLPPLEACIAGGVRIVQYRNKMSAPHAEILGALIPLCRRHGVTLIVNDDIALAQLADGVHLGKDDGDIATARQRLGPDKIIGVSCYNSLPAALQAQQAGADYVAFGSVFTSSTKPQAPRASLELLREAKAQLHIPIVAIGGITLQNAPLAIAAGADAVAVISSVFGTPDVKQAAQDFSNLFK